MTATCAENTIKIRWMIRRDMPAVLAIESHDVAPWSEEEFIACLRQRNAIGMVAELGTDGPIVGFFVYELAKTHFTLLRMAVDPIHRRSGVGSRLAAKLIGKMSAERRRRIEIVVHERSLDGQRFLAAVGFRAVNVLRNYFDETSEDGYSFRFRYNPDDARCSRPFV